MTIISGPPALSLLVRIPGRLLSSTTIALGGVTLHSEVDPFSKVLASFAPLDGHPAGINNPYRNVTVVADTLILLRNRKLRLVAHDAISVVTPGGEVNELAESR